MSDDEQYEVDPNLWDAPTSGEGGAFWRPKAGGYRGKLVRFEEGPEFENLKDVKDPETGEKRKEKVKAKTVRWVFEVYRLSGKRVTFEIEEGDKAGQTQDATADGLASRAFSKGSKTGKWLAALGVEVDWKALLSASSGEQRRMQAGYMQQALGKWGLLSFGEAKNSDKIVLTEISKLDVEDDDDD